MKINLNIYGLQAAQGTVNPVTKKAIA